MKIAATVKYDTHEEKFEAVWPALRVWVVYKQWPTNKVERVAAFFQESNAREFAAKLVGKDGALIGLETITVHDEPIEKQVDGLRE
jgi:hypothetical protein